MAIARLLTTVVLPSFGLALVSTRTRGRSAAPRREKRIDVSVVRNDSARSDVFSCQETISTEESDPFPFEAALRAASPCVQLSDRAGGRRSPTGTTPSSGTER